MAIAKVNGREFDIEFHYALQGHRITVMEYVDGEWQTLPDYDYVLCIGHTYFDTLCNLASDLFDEAVHGETFAELLDIPTISSDDYEEEYA